MTDPVDDLLEATLVDAYNETEQLWAFADAFEAADGYPFSARVIGEAVQVEGVTFEGNERLGLTADCRRQGRSFQVALVDVIASKSPSGIVQLMQAYRRWLGADPE